MRPAATLDTLYFIFADTRAKQIVPDELTCYSTDTGPFQGDTQSDWLTTVSLFLLYIGQFVID